MLNTWLIKKNRYINGLNEKFDHHKELGNNVLKGFNNIKKL